MVSVSMAVKAICPAVGVGYGFAGGAEVPAGVVELFGLGALYLGVVPALVAAGDDLASAFGCEHGMVLSIREELL